MSNFKESWAFYYAEKLDIYFHIWIGISINETLRAT